MLLTYSTLLLLLVLLATGTFSTELVNDLLKECARMKEFDHPNVLNLKGVCLDGGPVPYIIMPFMTNGSLQSYLKENSESLVMDLSFTDPNEVVRSRLLQFPIHFNYLISAYHSEEIARYVLASCQRDGISGQQENCT